MVVTILKCLPIKILCQAVAVYKQKLNKFNHSHLFEKSLAIKRWYIYNNKLIINNSDRQ